jgi:hypothetical protein
MMKAKNLMRPGDLERFRSHGPLRDKIVDKIVRNYSSALLFAAAMAIIPGIAVAQNQPPVKASVPVMEADPSVKLLES